MKTKGENKIPQVLLFLKPRRRTKQNKTKQKVAHSQERIYNSGGKNTFSKIWKMKHYVGNYNTK